MERGGSGDRERKKKKGEEKKEMESEDKEEKWEMKKAGKERACTIMEKGVIYRFNHTRHLFLHRLMCGHSYKLQVCQNIVRNRCPFLGWPSTACKESTLLSDS